MALYPGAVFKPTSWGGTIRRNKQGRGILHVAVSNAKSLPPWNGNTWHFYIAKAAPDGSTDGSGGPAYCEQYKDTEYRAATSGAANDDAIGIETAGAAGPTHHNAEKWTRAQELRIADIMRWEAAQPGGAPLEVMPDAQPGRRGWGPHRLGIKHSGGPRPGWWQPGSEVWSSVLGKECPGDAKVAQIPGIVQLARTGQAPEDDMTPAQAAQLAEILANAKATNGAVAAINIAVRDRTGGLVTKVAALTGHVAALAEAVSQLAGGDGLDPAVIAAAAEKGAEKALSDLGDALKSADEV